MRIELSNSQTYKLRRGDVIQIAWPVPVDAPALPLDQIARAAVGDVLQPAVRDLRVELLRVQLPDRPADRLQTLDKWLGPLIKPEKHPRRGGSYQILAYVLTLGSPGADATVPEPIQWAARVSRDGIHWFPDRAPAPAPQESGAPGSAS